ncbi:MAG: peptidylprolyl isomerase [Saprospiraceae bacterium]|nr:peptidylprolyl isomerase [Saprospiraceae bacterium]
MKGSNRALFTCILILGLASFANAQSQVIDKVIGTVGGEYILLSDVLEQKAKLEAQQGTLPENIDCILVEGEISRKLLINQAKLDSLLITEDEIQTQLNTRVDQILTYMNGDEQQFEDYYGQSVSEFKVLFREDIESQMLAERMRGQIALDIKVTPSEVNEFFQGIPDDSLPYFNSEVEIGEIVVSPKVNMEERSKAQEKAKGLLEQIQAGADFADLAKKNSMDGSARIGGDLGWTKRGSFVPEFEASAYNLEEMEISDLVESEFGFHIIQLLERRGNSIHTRHILIKPAITDEDLSKTENELLDIKRMVGLDSLSFSIAVKKYGSDKEQSFNNDGRMMNPQTQNTFFQMNELDPDIFFTIDTMKVGELSNPFQLYNVRGEVQYKIIQLQSRTNPHTANLLQDYSKIQAAASDKKKNEFVNEWVNQTIKNTFIEIKAEYATCPEVQKWVSK